MITFEEIKKIETLLREHEVYIMCSIEGKGAHIGRFEGFSLDANDNLIITADIDSKSCTNESFYQPSDKSKEFDWDVFNREEIEVHCCTEEEAKDFLRKAKKHAFRWIVNDNNDTRWNCINPNYGIYYSSDSSDTKHLFYDDIHDQDIPATVEWSDYMDKTNNNEIENNEIEEEQDSFER